MSVCNLRCYGRIGLCGQNVAPLASSIMVRSGFWLIVFLKFAIIEILLNFQVVFEVPPRFLLCETKYTQVHKCFFFLILITGPSLRCGSCSGQYLISTARFEFWQTCWYSFTDSGTKAICFAIYKTVFKVTFAIYNTWKLQNTHPFFVLN